AHAAAAQLEKKRQRTRNRKTRKWAGQGMLVKVTTTATTNISLSHIGRDVQLRPPSPAPAHTRSVRVPAMRLPCHMSDGKAPRDIHPLAPSPEEFV
ncbi:hypothetical protein MGN70_008984, partial [Eutypa lata]